MNRLLALVTLQNRRLCAVFTAACPGQPSSPIILPGRSFLDVPLVCTVVSVARGWVRHSERDVDSGSDGEGITPALLATHPSCSWDAYARSYSLLNSLTAARLPTADCRLMWFVILLYRSANGETKRPHSCLSK